MWFISGCVSENFDGGNLWSTEDIQMKSVLVRWKNKLTGENHNQFRKKYVFEWFWDKWRNGTVRRQIFDQADVRWRCAREKSSVTLSAYYCLSTSKTLRFFFISCFHELFLFSEKKATRRNRDAVNATLSQTGEIEKPAFSLFFSSLQFFVLSIAWPVRRFRNGARLSAHLSVRHVAFVCDTARLTRNQQIYFLVRDNLKIETTEQWVGS